MPAFRTRITALAMTSALALGLAACGLEDAQDNVASEPMTNFALGGVQSPYDFALDDFATGDFDRSALPQQALPLQASYAPASSYSMAPSWDYGQGGYADYPPQQEWDYYGADYEPDYYSSASDDYYYDDRSTGSDQFTWLALGAMIGAILGDSPPDYGFGYDRGVEPWAWRTNDGYRRYAEPVHGGYRYYYYEPESYRPFLVSDPYYSYGYRDDRLMAIYDRRGRLLRSEYAARQRAAARSYYDRGERLYYAERRGDRHGVSAPLWAERLPAIRADRYRWDEVRGQRKGWRDWSKKQR